MLHCRYQREKQILHFVPRKRYGAGRRTFLRSSSYGRQALLRQGLPAASRLRQAGKQDKPLGFLGVNRTNRQAERDGLLRGLEGAGEGAGLLNGEGKALLGAVTVGSLEGGNAEIGDTQETENGLQVRLLLVERREG